MIKNKKGFTVIEMLIVIAIIAMLLGLIIPNLLQKQQMINDKGCEALSQTVNSQIYMYYLNENEYPKNINDLISKEYLSKEQIVCDNTKKIEIKDNQAIVVG